jgi:hypothetical protein
MTLRILRALVFATGLVAAFLYAPNHILVPAVQVKTSEQTVSAKDLKVTCSGPVYLGGGTSGTSISSFKRNGRSVISQSYSGISGSTLVSGHGDKTQGFGVRRTSTDHLKAAASLTVLDSSGSLAQGSQLLSANQIQFMNSKSMRGLLGAPCIRSRSEFWLVGGSASVGREALLVLTNPTRVDATVDLEIFTENGISHSAGLSGISVRAGRSAVLPLASFVFRSESLTVHVLSHGGSITALIQQKAVRGLSAAGADYIAPAGEAVLQSVFPGILIRGSADSEKLSSANDNYSDVQQLLRVFVPGTKDAKVTFEVNGSNDKTFGTVLSVTAPAGKVSDFKVSGLADGDYVGFLKSNVPVLSGFGLVRSKISAASYTDFAWLNPAESFSSTRYISVPAAGISKLSLVNPGKVPVQVLLTSGNLTFKHLVTAGAEVVVLAPAGQAIGINPSGGSIQSNLIVDIDGRIAAIPVVDEKNIGGKVEVSVF